MPDKRLTSRRTVGEFTIVASWYGGAYIDLRFFALGATPFEVINVRDYATDESTISFTQQALGVALTEWCFDNRDEIARYYENTHY